MKIVVLAQGKLKQAALSELVADYRARLARYVPVLEHECKDSAALARNVPKDAWLVALEVHGQALSSRALASRLESWGTQKKGNVCFVIGGAEGIPPELSAGADARLSLSMLTLPHRLVRLILYEQLYRAFTILRGEPYARED